MCYYNQLGYYYLILLREVPCHYLFCELLLHRKTELTPVSSLFSYAM